MAISYTDIIASEAAVFIGIVSPRARAGRMPQKRRGQQACYPLLLSHRPAALVDQRSTHGAGDETGHAAMRKPRRACRGTHPFWGDGHPHTLCAHAPCRCASLPQTTREPGRQPHPGHATSSRRGYSCHGHRWTGLDVFDIDTTTRRKHSSILMREAFNCPFSPLLSSCASRRGSGRPSPA